MNLEQAMNEVINGSKEALIECEDEKNRNVLRTMAFRMRNRLEKGMLKKEARGVGISNEDIDGILFLRVYLKPSLKIYTRDENGNLIKMEAKADDSAENLKTINLMLKDQKISRDQIIEIMTETYGMNIDEVIEILQSKDGSTEPIPHFPQDMLKREKLKLEDL